MFLSNCSAPVKLSKIHSAATVMHLVSYQEFIKQSLNVTSSAHSHTQKFGLFNAAQARKCIRNLFRSADRMYTDGWTLKCNFWAKCDGSGPAGDTEWYRRHRELQHPANGRTPLQRFPLGELSRLYFIYMLSLRSRCWPSYTHTNMPCVITKVMSTSAVCLLSGLRR